MNKLVRSDPLASDNRSRTLSWELKRAFDGKPDDIVLRGE
jgi:hypothetical protein